MVSPLPSFVSHVSPMLRGRGREREAVSYAPLKMWPTDPWPTTSEYGQWLLSGLVQYPAGFDAGVDAFWSSDVCGERHIFAWLSDLKAMGGDQARQSARILVASWVEQYGNAKKRTKKYNGKYGGSSESLVAARRILHLLQSYDFHGASATDSYQSLVSLIVHQDSAFLYKKLSGAFANVSGRKDYLYQSVALLCANICLPEHKAYDAYREAGEQVFLESLKAQILPDGGHIRRSPQDLVEVLRVCLDLRRLYQVVSLPFPEAAQFAIDRMVQALKVFCYTDKRLGVFHGGREYHENVLDLIFHQTGQNRRIVKSLPQSGYERLSQGRTVLLMDVGNVSPAPFDRQAHIAPLAFEMSHGKDRIVVNCGTHDQSPEWRDALRRTAAHSTLTLDDRDAMSVTQDGGVRGRPSDVVSERHDEKGAVLLEAMHNGYSSIFEGSGDVRHVRRVYVSDKGQDVRGEDSVFREKLNGEDFGGAIRFHLHPKVRVSLVRNGSAALLRLFSGVGWRFQCSGATLSLEDSVYMGSGSNAGVPMKTQQLVLRFSVGVDSCGESIKWAFQRDVT